MAQIMGIVHNVVAHPLFEICYWLGFIAPPAREFGQWLHDATVPEREEP